MTDEALRLEELKIERLAHGPAAIAHDPTGKTVFVEGACPGDVVCAEVTDCSARYDRARIVELVEPSDVRVPASKLDPLLGKCCPWQQVEYESQLAAKAQNVADALVRIGRFSRQEVQTAFAGVCASERQWGYRNKAEFEAGADSLGHLVLGVRFGEELASLKSFPLLPKSCAKAPAALQGALRYLQGNGDLKIERVGLRASSRTGSVELALWTSPGPFPRAVAAKVASSAIPATSVTRVVCKGSSSARKVVSVEVLSGKGFWAEDVAGERMLISAPSFFQVNTPGAERLVRLVLEWLEPCEGKELLDLYSGAGTFTLPLARAGASVTAVEASGSAVRDLRRNLEVGGLFAEVIGGDVARELPEDAHAGGIVLDPPRSGLGDKALQRIADICAPKMAYVSCDPATLARDLARLTGLGYRLERIHCVDLFPQTYHIETVCLMSRADK